MKPFSALLLPVFLVCTPVAGADLGVSGDWEWRGGNEAGAWLSTERNGDTVRFHLELNRGAPSYNSGEMSGAFTLRHHVGIHRPAAFPECTLVFAFFGDTVQVEQIGSGADCGFGFSVMAGHVLSRKAPSE